MAVFVASSWIMMARAPQAIIRRRAAQMDDGKWAILILSILGAVSSLLAIGFEIHGAKDLGPARQILHVSLAMATILISWFFIHTIFALHYAHEHFLETGADQQIKGGLVFPGTQAPRYIEFLYFSFIIGMTGQTSDVGIAGHDLRWLALIQGIIAFFFNTVILALTINIAAGLL